MSRNDLKCISWGTKELIMLDMFEKRIEWYEFYALNQLMRSSDLAYGNCDQENVSIHCPMGNNQNMCVFESRIVNAFCYGWMNRKQIVNKSKWRLRISKSNMCLCYLKNLFFSFSFSFPFIDDDYLLFARWKENLFVCLLLVLKF